MFSTLNTTAKRRQSRMLRIHLVQNCFSLSDLAMEDALDEVPSMCSGQLIPDTALSFSSATAGGNPLVELTRPLPVVALHQKTTNILLSQRHAHVPHCRYPLCFQAAKQTFHRGVVVTVSASTHALLESITPQALAKAPASVLAALIAVEQHVLRAATLLCHTQSLDDQVGVGL